LEHAAQRIREGRSYGKDIDHRLDVNLVVVITVHAGSSQVALRFRLAREQQSSRRILVQTGDAQRIGTPLGVLLH